MLHNCFFDVSDMITKVHVIKELSKKLVENEKKFMYYFSRFND